MNFRQAVSVSDTAALIVIRFQQFMARTSAGFCDALGMHRDAWRLRYRAERLERRIARINQ